MIFFLRVLVSLSCHSYSCFVASMIMTAIALSFVAPSLLLAFTCTEYVLYLCFQLPKTNIASCVHHTYLLAFFSTSVHILYAMFSSKIKCLYVLIKLVKLSRT